MKKNWYRRMLLSYFPVFLLTITILIFLSFIVINDISHKETVKADRITTSYMVDRLSRALNTIDMDVLEEIQKNNSYNDVLDTELTNKNQQIVFDVVDSMRKLVSNDNLLDSIYIYRSEDKKVLTSSGFVPWRSFADKAFIEQALDNQNNQGWSSIRNYHEFSTEKDKSVISIFKREPLPFGTDGLIVINVDMYAIQQMILSMNNSNVSFVNVRDEAGNVLFSTSGTNEVNVSDSSRKVLNRVHSDLLGWKFESGITAGTLFMWVSVISYVWVAIGLLTVVLAIGYIIYITRRNYKPIRVMMNRVESIQLRKNEFGMKMDELSMIDHTLENLIQQTETFEKQQRENLLVRRRQLFHDMIQGNMLETVPEQLLKLGLLPKGETLEQIAFVLVEIDQYRNFRSGFSIRDQHTLKFALTNVLQELAEVDGMYGWAEWIAENRMGMIVGLREGHLPAMEKIRSFAEKGIIWVNDHLKISLLFGVGHVEKDWIHVDRSYEAALEVLQHKMSLGERAVIMSEDLPEEAGYAWYKYIQFSSELVREFRLLSGGWRVHLDQLFEHMEKDCLKDEEIRMLLHMMMEMLGSEISELSEELQMCFKGEAADTRERLSEETRTIERIKSLYSEQLAEIYRIYVSHSESKNHRAMINELKTYIEENFENPDLSLKHLSDRFHVSGKYVSYLFKEEFNMKFVDFIVQLRMERAEELLVDTEESVQQIALQVGYANSITFGRVFKRMIGVTPGDYRKLKLKPQKPRYSRDI